METETKKTNTESFETALQRLEKIVHTLEAGEASLSESLAAFEEGIGLVNFCNGELDRAEQKVKLLLEKDDGSVQVTDFRVENGES